MAIEQIAVVVVEVHAAAETIAEHLAIGTRPPPSPLPIAERLEAILPHVPELILVDIALVEVGANRRTPGDRPVDADRRDRDPGGALVEMIADVGLVTTQETLASVADVDTSLLAGSFDELQHFAKLGVGQP